MKSEVHEDEGQKDHAARQTTFWNELNKVSISMDQLKEIHFLKKLDSKGDKKAHDLEDGKADLKNSFNV